MSETRVSAAEVAESHALFAATEFGQRLARNSRYGDMKFAARVSNHEWQHLLGADVNNLKHMAVTRGLARDFVRVSNVLEPSRISDEEAELVVVAAEVHDRAEAIKGDINYNVKTAADEIAEQQAFREHILDFGVTSPRMKYLTERAIEEVLWNHDSPVGAMLGAVECVGYMRTCLRAADRVVEGRTRHMVDRSLRWVAADVLRTTTPRLLNQAQIFPAVGQYLVAQQGRISTAFEVVSGYDNFLPYGQEKITDIREEFGAAYDSWKSACAVEAAV